MANFSKPMIVMGSYRVRDFSSDLRLKLDIEQEEKSLLRSQLQQFEVGFYHGDATT